MAVMTHAQTLPTTAHYDALTRRQQDDFDRVMEAADTEATNAHEYLAMMAVISVYAGIDLPASKDIARCDCYLNGCGCDLIFDSNLPGVVITAGPGPKCNLSSIQCPDCGHDHPRPVTD
jgi:ethanolamine utilization protein EutP (predicted NTPase)